MPPKVPLIIPERKLLNSVCWEVGSCLFLSPCWEGGRARAASCKHPRRSQALRGRAMGTPPTPRLGEETGGLWVPGYVPDGAGGSARTSSGGWRHLNPLSQEEARPSAVHCLPSDRSFSLPRVSGCAPMAVLCRCYFSHFCCICLLTWGRRWKIRTHIVFLHCNSYYQRKVQRYTKSRWWLTADVWQEPFD